MTRHMSRIALLAALAALAACSHGVTGPPITGASSSAPNAVSQALDGHARAAASPAQAAKAGF